MKKTTLFLLVVLCSIMAGFAQKPYSVADKMNVLYAGIENTITVHGANAHIEVIGCSVVALGNGCYKVVPPTSLIGKNVKIKSISGSETNEQTFRVVKVPDPTPYIGANIWGGKRTKTELLAIPFISARMDDSFPFDIKWEVTSYRVVVISRGIEGAPIECEGGSLSSQVTSAINSASTGTVIIFQDIKVSSGAGQRTLRDITVRIK